MAKPRKLLLGSGRPADRDESEVRWLISYSDFMMQLVCLFILLYSVSSLDRGRMIKAASAYRASVGVGEPAANEKRVSGERLAIGERSLLGGQLGGGDLPRDLRFRIEPQAGGLRVIFEEALFEPASATLTARGRESLDSAARVASAYAGATLVTGFGDDAGEGDALRLAISRSEAAVAHLTRPGFRHALDARFVAAAGRASGAGDRVTLQLRTN